METLSIGQLLSAPIRHWWLSILLLAAVMVGDAYYTMTRHPTYLARSTLVVGPSAAVEPGSLVYSVDSLGRGRIMGTYAEVLGSDLVRHEAWVQLGYDPDGPPPVIVRSSTVAETTVLQISVESFDPELSANLANAIGDVGILRMSRLYPIYTMSALSTAVPPTTPYRPDPVRNYSIGLAIGLSLAVLASYLLDLLVASREGRKVSAHDEARGVDEAPSASRSIRRTAG